MPRIARHQILYDGCYAHIISRSIRKLKLFRDDEDFDELYRLFKLTRSRAGYKIHHYCFMQTHFHLAAHIPDVRKFSKAIGFIKSQYCAKFHLKYRLSGPIWRERYKGLLIENENYLYLCGEYIENNPVKAGLIQKPEDWEYSSKRYYNGHNSDPLVDQYAGYDQFKVSEMPKLDSEAFFENGKAIGSPFFRFQIHEKLKRS